MCFFPLFRYRKKKRIFPNQFVALLFLCRPVEQWQNIISYRSQTFDQIARSTMSNANKEWLFDLLVWMNILRWFRPNEQIKWIDRSRFVLSLSHSLIRSSLRNRPLYMLLEEGWTIFISFLYILGVDLLFPICVQERSDETMSFLMLVFEWNSERTCHASFSFLGHMIMCSSSSSKRKMSRPKWIWVYSGVLDQILINKRCLVYSVIVTISNQLGHNHLYRIGQRQVHHNGIILFCKKRRFIHRVQWWANWMDLNHRWSMLLNDLCLILAIEHQVNCWFHPEINFLSLSFSVSRVLAGVQPLPKLEFSTPTRSLTPDLYNRVSSSIKRTRVAPTIGASSAYDTPSPPQPSSSTFDSAE